MTEKSNHYIGKGKTCYKAEKNTFRDILSEMMKGKRLLRDLLEDLPISGKIPNIVSFGQRCQL